MNRNTASIERSSMPIASTTVASLKSASPNFASAIGRGAAAGAQVNIERVSIIAEGVAGSDLQRHGERLAGEIGAVLSRHAGRGSLRIGELSLRIAVDQLNDPVARERIASSVARRILDSLQD
jgi:hypothetical protein